MKDGNSPILLKKVSIQSERSIRSDPLWFSLDPGHVKRLGIDDFTFFIQKPTDNGIFLELCRLDICTRIEGEEKK